MRYCEETKKANIAAHAAQLRKEAKHHRESIRRLSAKLAKSSPSDWFEDNWNAVLYNGEAIKAKRKAARLLKGFRDYDQALEHFSAPYDAKVGEVWAEVKEELEHFQKLQYHDLAPWSEPDMYLRSW